MRKILIAMLAGCYSALSLAQFSVGVDLARVESDIFSSLSEEDYGYRVEFGYPLNDTWNVVGGYADYGDFFTTSSAGDLAIEGSAAHLGIESRLALSDEFGFFAEAGLDFWELDVDNPDDLLPMPLDDSGEGFYFGAGAYVKVSEGWQIHFSYSDRDWDDYVDVQVLRLGFRVALGGGEGGEEE